MKLYSATASPFARKVRVCLLELGIEGQVEFMDAHTTPVSPNDMLIKQNPLGKIPCLISEDGAAIYDSRVITRYLNDQNEGGLYPSGARLWEALTLEATADGMMEAAVLMVYEKRVRPEDMVYNLWVEAQWDKVERALDALESGWKGHLDGPLDMAQIAVGVVLEYLDFRHDDRNWRKGRDALSKWQAEFAQRDTMQKTQPGV